MSATAPIDPTANEAPFAYRRAFLALLVTLFVAKLVFATTLPLSGDEAYHWEWSRRLAPSYYDHPGLTAVVIWLSSLVLPAHSELMVRFGALLCLTATAGVAYLFAHRVARSLACTNLVCERAGFLAGILTMFVPVLALLSLYMSTDPPFLLFATLSLWLFWEGLEHGRWRAWLGAGMCLGLAATAKFLAFLIPPSVTLVTLLHAPWRRWWLRPQPWLAMATALAVFTPVLVWNAQHDWATFRFNFAIRQGDNKLSLFTPLEYFAGQFAVLSPLVLFAAFGAIRRSWREWRTQASGALLFLTLATVLPIGFFFASSFQRSIGAHWPAALWVPILIALAVHWARGHEGRLSTRWTLGTCIGLTALLPLVAHIPPSWTLPLAWGGRPDRLTFAKFYERFGWPELGQRVDAACAEMRAAEPQRDVVAIAGKYGLAASVAFYTPSQRRVLLWAPRRRHGENYRFWDCFADFVGHNAVFVAKERGHVDSERAGLSQHFAHVGAAEEVPILVDGQRVRSFWLVRCWNYDGREPF